MPAAPWELQPPPASGPSLHLLQRNRSETQRKLRHSEKEKRRDKVFKGKPNLFEGVVGYFSSEKQGTKSEDCGHLDDGQQQLVGFHNALRLLLDSPPSSAGQIFPFKDSY